MDELMGMAGGMNPMSAGMGALESLTGGSSGPITTTSTNTNTTNNSSGFGTGDVSFGSNNGIPSWALIGGLALVAIYVLKSKK